MLLVTVAIGLGALAIVTGSDDRHVSQTSGILVIAPVAGVAPGSEACQQPMAMIDDADSVGFTIDAARPTPPLTVRVRDSRTRETLARSEIAAGFDPGLVTTHLDRTVPAERSVAVCVANNSRHGVYAVLRGDDGKTDLCKVAPGSVACRWRFAHPTSTTSTAYVDGTAVTGTMNVVFFRPKAESVLAQTGKIMDRLSRFRPGFVSPALWIMLVLLATVAAPLALWFGLRAAFED